MLVPGLVQARRVQVQVRRFISAGGELDGAQVDRAHLLAGQFLLRPLALAGSPRGPVPRHLPTGLKHTDGDATNFVRGELPTLCRLVFAANH